MITGTSTIVALGMEATLSVQMGIPGVATNLNTIANLNRLPSKQGTRFQWSSTLGTGCSSMKNRKPTRPTA